LGEENETEEADGGKAKRKRKHTSRYNEAVRKGLLDTSQTRDVSGDNFEDNFGVRDNFG
jgi:hypothetical protein